MSPKTKTKTKSEITAETMPLSEAMELVAAGHTQRDYSLPHAETGLAMTMDLMFAPEDREYVQLVDASSDKAREILGADYCAERNTVLLVTHPTKVRGKVKPSTSWLGVPPIIGVNPESGQKNVNDGQHRIGSAFLGASDLERCMVDIPLVSDLKIRVTVATGSEYRHGVQANKSTKGDSPREDFDNLWPLWIEHPKERRDHYKREDYNVKVVQYGFMIFQLIWNALFFLKDKVKIYDVESGKQTEVKGTEYIQSPGTVRMSDIAGLEDLGNMLRAFFRASLDVAGIQKVAELPKALVEQYPFRLTYDRLKELFNCCIVDSYTALCDPEIMAMPAHERFYFKAAWKRFSKDGWERSAATPKAKVTRNKVGADQVRAMFKPEAKGVQDKAEELAKMFESGQPTPALKPLIKAASRPALSLADFLPALQEILPPESKEKIAKGDALNLVKAAIGATISTADKGK